MTARVKLITEWVTWIERQDCYILEGAVDHIAFISANKEDRHECTVYTETAYESDAWYYRCDLALDAEIDTATFDSVDAAKEACIEYLLSIGLIDLLWWVTQCRDE